jgi:hypothetical protein
MKKIVAMHQPNFFPWLGFFDKIAKADVFIFLDDVQFPKTGGVWTNRVKFIVSGEPNWITAPIDRNYSGKRNINEMHFFPNNSWRDKTRKSIENSYRKHPYYDETIEMFLPLLLNQESNIAEYNIQAITAIVDFLGLDTSKLKRSSHFSFQSMSNELLCDLTLHAGGSIYLAGGGADDYQDEAVFVEKRVKLIYQQFDHPVYEQKGQFYFNPGMSIIDVVMNMGWDWVKKFMNQTPG